MPNVIPDPETCKMMGSTLKGNINETVDKLSGNVIIKADERFDNPDEKISGYLVKLGAKHSIEFFNVGYTPEDGNAKDSKPRFLTAYGED